jgi:hypothetical protein
MDEKNANVDTGSEEGTLDLLDMTPNQERALKRKVDIAVIPYCTLLFLLSASAPTHSLFTTGRCIIPFSDFLDRVCRLVEPACAEGLMLSVAGQYWSSSFGGS